jgi:hypothetical protein
LDLAVSSPLRQGALQLVLGGTTAAVQAYEQEKRDQNQTAAHCTAQGMHFVPMVAEPSGGWGPSGLAALRRIARATEASSARAPGTAMREFLQQLSITIRRADARAVLRRMGEPPPPTGPSQARELLRAMEEAEAEDARWEGIFG